MCSVSYAESHDVVTTNVLSTTTDEIVRYVAASS